ncbi:MAG: tRNA uridine(34) 5-carboxymethylaminomethyl modification radical SAM/GNAT enzyme Elp3 [Candidatus Micrarchaeota archaeon]
MDSDYETRLDAYSRDMAAQIEADEHVDVEALKKTLAKKYKVRMIKSAAVIARLSPALKTDLVMSRLRTRLTRTGSGVTPIALMPKPFVCPGKCTYCPTAKKEEGWPDGPKRSVLFAPKAYTGFEPATRRAIQNEYDAKRQIDTRISQYEALGQPTQKCELIVMGGTFLSVPLDYQHKFIQECFEALNGNGAPSLEAAQKENETAEHRMIGMTIETRPDWCKKVHIDRMLKWGATRVELGVQSLDDEVLEKVKRGHGQKEAIRATRELKDCAFKVGYHFMPGLYSSREKDVLMLKQIFSDANYKPDMLKIYPCLVMPGTPLFEEYKAGRFEPIDSEEAVLRVVEATKYFPPWVRVMRMQRDIPANLIAAGVKAGNLHQMVLNELKRRGEKCMCIRCREVFSTTRLGEKSKALKFEMVERSYEASGGFEHFLSFEDSGEDLLAGFIRLRLGGKSHREEISGSTALIRELHVYGQELSIGLKEASGTKVQHSGMGKKLLARAEQIANEGGRDKLAIISGVGAREYYRKLGYSLEGPYMCKKL